MRPDQRIVASGVILTRMHLTEAHLEQYRWMDRFHQPNWIWVPDAGPHVDDHSGFYLGPDEDIAAFSARLLYDLGNKTSLLEIAVQGKNGFIPEYSANVAMWDTGYFLGAINQRPYEPRIHEVFRVGDQVIRHSEPIPWSFTATQNDFYSIFHFDLMCKDGEWARIEWNHAATRIRP